MKRIFNILLILILSLFLVFTTSCEFELGYSSDTEDKDLNEVFESLFKDVDVTKVSEDLKFKTLIDGVRVKYESENNEIISNTGKVTRGEEDVTVKVKITLTYKNSKYTDFVTFTVLKSDGSGQDNPPVVDDELAKAISQFEQNKDNFRLVVKETCDGEFVYEADYSVDGNYVFMLDSYVYEGEEYLEEYYFELSDGDVVLLIYSDVDNEFYSVSDLETIYSYLDYMDFYFDYYDFTFNVDDFEKSDSKYILKADALDEAAKSILGDFSGETFVSFSLELKDGNLYKITAKSNYSSDNTTNQYEYELVFAEFGEQKVELPEATEEQQNDKISDVYQMEKGDSVLISGYVTGFLGQNVYVSDGTASICVYYANKTYLPEGLELHSLLTASGTVDIFNGLYEVKVASAEDSYVESGIDFENVKYEDLSKISLDKMSDVIDLTNVKLDSIEVSATKDTSLTLTDKSGNTMTLFVKKANADKFSELFKDVDINKNLIIKSLVVSVYKTNVQLTITEQTEVELLKGLFVNKTSLSANLGTEINDILSALEFKFYGDEEIIVPLSNLSYTSDYVDSIAGTYTFVFTYQEASVSVKVTLYENGVFENVQYDILEKVTSDETTFYPGLPSTGDVEVLVIPIRFTNSKDYDLTVIEKAFNGTNEETGWYSLNGYYLESSYGKLNIHANVTEPFDTNVEYNLKAGKTGVEDYQYFIDALNYFDDEIDYSRYDQNGDGYLDCVYLIYLAPYMSLSSHSDLWWAYCYEYFEDEEEVKFDGIGLDWYLWASYEFFQEPISVDYDNMGNPIQSSKINVNINCETIIHETGHALGLDDYYDYNSVKGPVGGVGGLVMMDTNQGDHDPFSKMILGWINPTVISGVDYEGTITSFTDFGDCILIIKEDSKTYFTEMYIVALYTPTKANELKCDKECGLPSISGVTIYHIDAKLKDNLDSGEDGVIDIYQFNNGDTEHKLIKLIEADGNEDIEADNYASNDDLFQTGDSTSLTWYDGTSAFTIEFSSVSDNGATFNINFN